VRDVAQVGQEIGVQPGRVADVADLYRERAVTLKEMAEGATYFYQDIKVPVELIVENVTGANRAALQSLVLKLADAEWSKQGIAATVKALAADFKLKMPQLMMPLRVAISGRTQTPAIDAVMAVLGREKSLARISAALSV